MIRTVLAAELAASALLGSWILESDQWLWSSAPSHAYGLVGFIIIDLVLALALARGVSRSLMLTLGAAFIQAVAMLSDLVGGQPMGVSSSSFRGYLLGDSYYVALLGIQFAVIFMGLEMELMRFLHHHPRLVAISQRVVELVTG